MYVTGIDEDDYSLFSEVHALYMYSVHECTHCTGIVKCLGKYQYSNKGD